MKKIFLFLMSAVLAFGLASCGDDRDDYRGPFYPGGGGGGGNNQGDLDYEFTANKFWGGYYGVIIIISIFLEPLKNWFYEKTKISRNNVFIQIWQHLLTLFLLAFGKILFMCNDLSSTWQMFVQCFHWNNLSLQNIWNQIGDSSFFTAISCFAPIFIVDLIQEIWPKTSFLSKFNRLPIYVRWPIMIALIVVIVWFGWYGNGLPHFDFGYTLL